MSIPEKENLSEWYNELLQKAEIVDGRYPVKGMLIYRKWGLFAIRKMEQTLEQMLEKAGHEPVLFPVLIPEDTLAKESGHIAGFEDEVFWVTHAGKNKLDRRLSLRPTSETPIYEMFSLWLRSHNDLPLKVHQSGAVYRYETKHTRPLIRGREFLWNEGHTAHAGEKEAKANVEEIKDIYSRLIGELLCLPFEINKRPEWDKFPGAKNTYAFDTLMPDGRTLQIATVHNLGTNFSDVFDITYEDEEGKHQIAHQCSYGPSFGRLLASAICIHGDDNGLVLPPGIAPVQIVLIPILFKESVSEKIMSKINEIKEKLEKEGYRVEIDDSEERPGAKFYHWEMKGVPLRIELGPRDLEKEAVTVVRRDTLEKQQMGFDNLQVEEIFAEIEENMRKQAKEKFQEGHLQVNSIEKLKKNSGVAIMEAGWCGKEECAREIEEHADVLASEAGKEKEIECIVCGEKGRKIKAAKTY